MSDFNINIIDNQVIGVDTRAGVIGGVASNISIADAGSLITATTVEGALQEVATNINLKANKVQEAWITPTLLNGWVGDIFYAKDSMGKVTIYAPQITAGTVTSLTTIIGELPVGYRPMGGIVVPLMNNASGIIHFGYLTTNGSLKISPTNNNLIANSSRVTFEISYIAKG